MKPAHRLTAAHRAARRTFARNNMFTDRSKFTWLDGNLHYWRDLRKEPVRLSRRNFGGGTLMVWGAFSSLGTLDLQLISTCMNSEQYCDVLEGFCSHSYEAIVPTLHLPAQQCGCTCFTNDRVLARVAALLEWPSCSPDLNPIESLWGILVRRVYANGRQYSTLDSLRKSVLSEWNSISLEIIEKVDYEYARSAARSHCQ
ncbi:hypothetical protein OESDEN_02231 [Oesophagostomum dentatum]|uniref:Tc1-like transposase DDE domain-containing protein n=1 Tax=Oesophagostomum dentatum TaxID=61180 RepID=A0A0B1TNW2_OESDE|nr:hypothetical protein OESDEN_02231 [Oesophagostomum dentatum]